MFHQIQTANKPKVTPETVDCFSWPVGPLGLVEMEKLITRDAQIEIYWGSVELWLLFICHVMLLIFAHTCCVFPRGPFAFCFQSILLHSCSISFSDITSILHFSLCNHFKAHFVAKSGSPAHLGFPGPQTWFSGTVC